MHGLSTEVDVGFVGVDRLDEHVNISVAYFILIVVCAEQFTDSLNSFLDTDNGCFLVDTLILYARVMVGNTIFSMVVEQDVLFIERCNDCATELLNFLRRNLVAELYNKHW